MTGPVGEWSGSTGAGGIFDLEQPRTAGMPLHPSHQPGYSYLLHRHHEEEYEPEKSGPRTSASGMILCMEHTGTHIDALCHQAEDLELYGGVPVDGAVQTSRGFARLGVEEIPPIVVPGVLLDVAASKGVAALEPGYAITDEDLKVCSGDQGVEVEPGSVALVRTSGTSLSGTSRDPIWKSDQRHSRSEIAKDRRWPALSTWRSTACLLRQGAVACPGCSVDTRFLDAARGVDSSIQAVATLILYELATDS